MSRVALLILLALGTAAGCRTTKAQSQTDPPPPPFPAHLLHPWRLLPQDAVAYVQVTPEGLREVTPLLQSLLSQPAHAEEDDLAASVTGPRLLLELGALLDLPAAESGLDPAKPVFLSFYSADTDRLEVGLELGGLVDPEHLPDGVLTTVLLPAADAALLEQAVAQWWARRAESTQHRITKVPGWVRLDVFGGANLEQALARSQRSELRLTPAAAEWLTAQGDLRLYVPLDRLRSWNALTSAAAAYKNVRFVSPKDRDVILAAAASELSDAWLFTDPATAEVEDLALAVEVTPGKGLAVQAALTLTALGRELADGPGPELRLPALEPTTTFLDATVLADTPMKVPLPTVATALGDPGADGPSRADQLTYFFHAAQRGRTVAMLRSPRSFLRLFASVDPNAPALSERTALRVRAFGFTARPGIAGLFLMPDAKTAEDFVRQSRAKGPLSKATISLQQLASGPGGDTPIFMGIGTTPEQVLETAGTWEAVPLGLRAEIAPSMWPLFLRRRPLPPLLASGPAQVALAPDGPVARATLHVGAPSPVQVSVPQMTGFKPRRYTAPDDCRLHLRQSLRDAIRWVSRVDQSAPFTQRLARVDEAAACVSGDAKLEAYVAAQRARLVELHARSAAPEN